MSDWFKDQEQQTEETAQTPVVEETNEPPVPPTEEPTPIVEQPVQPEQPAQPAEPETPAAPETPAVDWRANPYTTPTQPSYESGWYRSGPMSQPQPQYTQPTPPTPPQKRHSVAVVLLSIVAVLAILAMAGTLVLVKFGYLDEEPLPQVDEQDEIINDDAPALNITDWADDDGGLSATEIIDKNLDSTVVINVYQMQVPGNGYSFGFGQETLTQVGEATGIVYDPSGYIITNWHVVINESTGEEYDRVDVVLHDGTVYEGAQVLGADQSTDLAVIKVDGENMAVAEFGDSSQLVMGSRVVTLGNAGGLQWSASQGIISGLARDVYEDTGYSIKCLQTDAAINPGNSGGPLLNNSGQVVGINSAKIVADGIEGLGFSIPINEAKAVIDDLAKYAYVRGRVELGITGYSIASNGYYGFVIKTIEKGSMLENTRARTGDLITAIDGVKISGYSELRSELAKHAAGDEVTLSLLRLNSRTGEETTFEVTCKLKESKPQN